MKLAISRCLLGERVRYDGAAKPNSLVQALASRPGVEVVPVCPEVAGGLPTPRTPCELAAGGRVASATGQDATAAYVYGARVCAAAVAPATGEPAALAILKAKSPSCGVGAVYDGTFTGTLTAGDGVFAQLLKEIGITVATEQDLERTHPTVEHPVALMLGSGMAPLAEAVRVVRHIPYNQIQDFPAHVAPVEGHTFEAVVGTLAGVPVVVYPGRAHLYQGVDASEVTALVRHAHALGCQTMVVVAASGAVNPQETAGIGLITDQLNLTAQNPLAHAQDLRAAKTPFISMNNAYTPHLLALCRSVAASKSIELHEGVYAGMVGPSFETPAEVAALATLGASYVGFSVVLETLMARALGMDVLGLTLCANPAGGAGVSHESVLAYAKDHHGDLEALITGVLELL
jgi:purine-nucleoside phosphorylase